MPETAASDRMFNCDVVVIGAGPAGSSAAWQLASAGFDVILLERRPFPREKVCGDGLIADSLACLKTVGLYDAVVQRGRRLAMASIYSPAQIRVDIPGEFVTLPRIELDEMLAQHAQAAGSRLWFRAAAALEPAQRSVTVRLEGGGRIRARICLIATGANLQLVRQMGADVTLRPSAVAMRCYVTSPVSVERLIGSYDRSVLPGYGWIFPVGGSRYNIGVVHFSGQTAGTNLKRVFQAFVEKFLPARGIWEQATDQTRLSGAQLRCGLSDGSALLDSRILAIGETISTTFPFTGEGIGKAMLTGLLAAQTSVEALHKGLDALHKFPQKVRDLQPKYRGYEIAQRWLSHPWLNDLVSWRAQRSGYLRNAIAGIINETVDPAQIFSLRGLFHSFIG